MKNLQVGSMAFLLALVFLWASLGSKASAATPWGPMSKIEASARKEGKLVIYSAPGHAGRESQREISKHFKERYGISIDWTTMSARQIAPRVLAEQRTKQYVVDIVMSGIAGNYGTLKPKGYVVPILAPSVLEKNVWRLDPAMVFPRTRDWLYFFLPLDPGLLINTNLVPAGQEPKSYQDLLDPKWKGKVVIQTPGRGGTGSGWFRATYRKLGLEYMRALAKQVVLVTKTPDSANKVARGEYAVGIAALRARGLQLLKEGAPIKFIQPKEGARLGAQGLVFIANAPHPNASKLFLQWLFTGEGQSVFARSNLSISIRKDVSQEYLIPELRYTEGQQFMMAALEDQQGKRPREILKLGKRIFEEGK